jgi:hypothetical protein
MFNNIFSFDSDNTSIPNITNIVNDNNSVLHLLAKRTVDYIITLNALSSLFKVLKVHRCFNLISVDGRT